MGISPISIVEEMAKDVRDKTDVECNFYQSAEDVSDHRDLSPEKKNLWYLMICYWKNKTHVNRIMSEEGTATSIVSNELKTISRSHVKQSENGNFMSVSPRPEEPKPHFRGSCGK